MLKLFNPTPKIIGQNQINGKYLIFDFEILEKPFSSRTINSHKLAICFAEYIYLLVFSNTFDYIANNFALLIITDQMGVWLVLI